MLNRRAITYFFNKALGRTPAIDIWPSDYEELSPAETRRAQAAIHLDDEIGRVISPVHATDMQREMLYVAGKPVDHGATVRYELKNVRVIDGHLYTDSSLYKLTKQRQALTVRDKLQELDVAFLGCSWAGNEYFGHWIADDLPLNRVPHSEIQAISTHPQLSPHQQFYADTLQIHTEPVKNAKVETLTVVQDLGQNQHKRGRYLELRERLRTRLATVCENKQVFIKRGSTGRQRGFLNEDEVADHLEKRGFEIVDIQNLNAEEIVKTLLDAKIVMGVDGSHLAHGLYTIHQDGVFVVIQPPTRFFNLFHYFLDCMGIRYAFTVGEQDGEGFRLSVDRVDRLLTLIDQKIGL